MIKFIKNVKARKAVLDKLANGQTRTSYNPIAAPHIRECIWLEGTNGQVSISVDRAGVRRYYDGVLVHEEMVRGK